MRLIETLRTEYPDPVTTYDRDPQFGYCVGGALCMHLGGKERFPDEWALTDILLTANPKLHHFDAVYFAKGIIDSNDKGEFEDAWQWLDTALNHNSLEHSAEDCLISPNSLPPPRPPSLLSYAAHFVRRLFGIK